MSLNRLTKIVTTSTWNSSYNFQFKVPARIFEILYICKQSNLVVYFFPQGRKNDPKPFPLFVCFLFLQLKVFRIKNIYLYKFTWLGCDGYLSRTFHYKRITCIYMLFFFLELLRDRITYAEISNGLTLPFFFHFFRPENGQEIGCGRRRRHSVRWLDQNRVREVERTGAAYNSPWGLFFFLFFSFCGLLWPCCDVAVFCHRPAVEIAPHYIMKYIYEIYNPNTKISQRKEKKKENGRFAVWDCRA